MGGDFWNSGIFHLTCGAVVVHYTLEERFDWTKRMTAMLQKNGLGIIDCAYETLAVRLRTWASIAEYASGRNAEERDALDAVLADGCFTLPHDEFPCECAKCKGVK